MAYEIWDKFIYFFGMSLIVGAILLSITVAKNGLKQKENCIAKGGKIHSIHKGFLCTDTEGKLISTHRG